MDNSNRRELVHADLVRQTLKLAPLGIAATLLNALLLVLALWKVVPHSLLLTWLAAALSLALLRSLRLRRYRSDSLSPADAARAFKELMTGLSLAGIVWGCLGIFLFPADSPIHQTLVVFVLCGMAAGALGAFSSLYSCYLAFTLPALLPITIRFFMIGDDIHYAMGAMTLLYIVLTLFIAKQMSTTNRERIELKEHFAAVVQERTADLLRTNERLKASERKHRALFEIMAQGVIYLNERAEIEMANPSAERILGFSSEQMSLIASPDRRWQLIDEDGAAFPEEAFPARVAMQTGTEVKDVVMGAYNPVEKGYRWLRAHAVPELQPGKQPPCRVYMTFDDITKAKQADDERRKLESHLHQAQKMEAIATLAGGIAHQFNNALSAISGNLELLEMDQKLDRKADVYVQSMKQSFHRMSHLTSQLLAYAEGGKYQPVDISLGEVVEEALALTRHTLDPAIAVHMDLKDEGYKVRVDVTQLQMVLSGLLSNAAEAMEQPGEIQITTAVRHVDEAFAAAHPGMEPGSYSCLAVRDDGKGMDEKTLAHVFEPFFTTKFQGRGLGMAAAYGIVKNHGGWIGLESEPGAGTLVWVYLPVVSRAINGNEATPGNPDSRCADLCDQKPVSTR